MTPSPRFFSLSALRDTASADMALMHELIEIFLRIVPPMAGRLRRAVGDFDASSIAHEAHSLRSCLTMIGAAELQARCRLLEAEARRQDIPLALDALALCDDIDMAVAEVREFGRAPLADAG